MEFKIMPARTASAFTTVLFTALVATLVTSAAPQAHAQSIYGPGGLFLNPSADLPEKGQITPAVLVMPQRLQQGGRLTWSSYSLDYGLSDKWEIGTTYLKVNPGSGEFKNGSAGLYAKYKVLAEVPRRRPALAVGGNFLEAGDSEARTAFAALRFSPTRPGAKHPAALHLGAMYIDKLDGIKYREWAPFAGAELSLTDHLSTFAEVRPRLTPQNGATKGTFANRSLGLVWKPIQHFKFILVYGSNGWNDKSSQLGFGIGYALRGGTISGK
jgi:hypothetical protein